jgi:transglutaminase-like putative cysteine protease
MSSALPAKPLDARTILWLVASMGFVAAPHALRLPWWVGSIFGLALAWRAWIAWRATRFPPRWLLLALTLGAVVATFVGYGRITGRDGGTTLLVLMVGLKLLEMRTSREVVLSIHLGFILVMTNFLFSQTIPTGLYMLACVWLFVATLVGFHRGVGRTPSLRERLLPSGMLILQALPLMLVFFLLFPRVQGPLWALPQDARAGMTGLSDSMTPGNISKLIQSEDVAFRVQFIDDMPPLQSLYWRGPVLTEFDGRTWRSTGWPNPNLQASTWTVPVAGRLDYERAERRVRYAVTVEPHGKHWLFGLDVPASLPPGASVRPDLQIRSVRPVDARLRYEMSSWLDYSFGSRLSPSARDPALDLDTSRNPRAVELGRQWARDSANPEEIVGRALDFFNRQFAYTLEPPLLATEHPYDEFLFTAKRGFCEHYSGSFALLMRAAGIPARVVTGYLGGEINPFNRELIVRQADAHAWVEVWLAERGWVRLDPTSIVSPVRAQGGINAALGPIGVLPSLIAADRLHVLANLRFAWETLNSHWNQWVLGYNQERQRHLLGRLGIDDVDWKSLALWLGIGSLVVGGLVGLGLVLRDLPRRRDAVVVAWDRYCAKLAAQGITRAPHEGPADYLARVAAARPDLAEEARAITERYIAARYGAGLSPEQGRELRRRVRAFRTA